jgi:Rrf2 family protein
MLALARADHEMPRGRSSRDSRLSVARIADSEAIPPPILPSVMRRLAHAGLVAAQTGRTGGYRLVRRADRISLLDIIEAVEGDTRRRVCILRGGPCLANGQCSVHGTFLAAQEALRSSLASATLESAATAPPGLAAGRLAPQPDP